MAAASMRPSAFTDGNSVGHPLGVRGRVASMRPSAFTDGNEVTMGAIGVACVLLQ